MSHRTIYVCEVSIDKKFDAPPFDTDDLTAVVDSVKKFFQDKYGCEEPMVHFDGVESAGLYYPSIYSDILYDDDFVEEVTEALQDWLKEFCERKNLTFSDLDINLYVADSDAMGYGQIPKRVDLESDEVEDDET